jgi:hypothetical protein
LSPRVAGTCQEAERLQPKARSVYPYTFRFLEALRCPERPRPRSIAVSAEATETTSPSSRSKACGLSFPRQGYDAPLKPRIHGLALQRQNPEDALVDAA